MGALEAHTRAQMDTVLVCWALWPVALTCLTVVGAVKLVVKLVRGARVRNGLIWLVRRFNPAVTGWKM